MFGDFVGLDVHQKRAALACHAEHGFFAGAGAHNRRVRLGVRARAQLRQLQIPVFALVHVVFCRPGFDHNVFGFEQALVSFFRIDAVALVIVDIESRAASQTDQQATVADVVDQRHLFRHAYRVVQ